MRLTIKNPDRRTYRLPCAANSEDCQNQPGPGGYPTLLGNKINILGKLEDIMPLEKILETLETKK